MFTRKTIFNTDRAPQRGKSAPNHNSTSITGNVKTERAFMATVCPSSEADGPLNVTAAPHLTPRLIAINEGYYSDDEEEYEEEDFE